MNNILIDTSIIIDFLRRKDREQTSLYKISDETLFISIITHTELYAGKSIWEKNGVKEALEKIIERITILTLETNISEKAGYIHAYHHDTSLIDCVIAATALTHNLELATLNEKDFKRISNLHLFPLTKN